MSTNIIISGITAFSAIQVFDGGFSSISDVVEEIGNFGSWIHSQMPENRFLRTSIYTISAVAFVRSLPFILRRTEFFRYFEEECYFFHRTCSKPEVMEMKEELLKELKNADLTSDKFPLINDKLTILELNIGSGTNCSYYPDNAVVIGTDFIEEQKENIENNFLFNDDERLTLDRYIPTRVEELASIPDNSISCVVSFHALCSARQTSRALSEIKRVLMPGGRYYFIEHTVERNRFTFLWLAQLNFSLSLFMYACCLKKMEESIEHARFSKLTIKQRNVSMRNARGPMFALTPHVYGYAIK
ncbi:thiol S-methyltransferase TMT1A-like [Clytia hemisphaerica]|uniref:Methyltransferase type 11 domain-containing protein n=1 Tax=Clytia hemisphaerica TaxID=252671 RepID=A0A7M5XMV9_9CNID